MRISQFFSVDTARSLVTMNEYYPDLMERIIRREPNAYIAALYWDSEMFGRNTAKRKELEKDSERSVDYKGELLKMFGNMDTYFPTESKKKVADQYRKLFVSISSIASERDLKEMYEALIKGDPKLRSYRALYQTIYSRYTESTKAELGVGARNEH